VDISPDYVRILSEECAQRAIDIRRHLCQWPEISGQEEKTSALVVSVLKQLGVPVKEKVGGFGVVGLIEGNGPGPTIAFRADMDALPLQDRKKAPYASKVPGVAHGCGHDVHTAILLGAAMVLSNVRESIPGRVKLIFQPAEESASGASRMMAEGALREPGVDCILALHCAPNLRVGEVGIKQGVTMAASDAFDIVILGKGGHAARPHETVDAVLVAANAISAIHQIVGRRIDPLTPAVITLGRVEGGTVRNVIAERVEIQGTMRCLDEEVRAKLMDAITEVLDGATHGMGAGYELTFTKRTPAVVNDGKVTTMVSGAAAEILGAGAVRPIEVPSMGGEDFAFYLSQVPGCFVRLGTGGEREETCHPLHSGQFDIDEGAIPAGIAFLSWAGIRLLGGRGS
jgi:amidohydrolase